MKYVVHCKKQPFDVYVGRGSIWGNPYSHLEHSKARYRVKTVEEAVEKYAEHLFNRPDLLSKIKYLRGRILGCWCDEPPCHAQILAALANPDYEF